MENKNLEALFKELSESKSLSRQASLRRDIRVIRNRLVKELDYEGIIHVLRFMQAWERDRLFIDLLNKHPDASLFILAFADSEMYSYETAHGIAIREYDYDEEAVNEDVALLLDEKLCIYLNILQKRTWTLYRNLPTVQLGLKQISDQSAKKLQELGVYFQFFFYKKTPNKSELECCFNINF